MLKALKLVLGIKLAEKIINLRHNVQKIPMSKIHNDDDNHLIITERHSTKTASSQMRARKKKFIATWRKLRALFKMR